MKQYIEFRNIGTKKKYSNINRNQTITQESYQRYAKFYGEIIPSDESFNIKINSNDIIYNIMKVTW